MGRYLVEWLMIVECLRLHNINKNDHQLDNPRLLSNPIKKPIPFNSRGKISFRQEIPHKHTADQGKELTQEKKNNRMKLQEVHFLHKLTRFSLTYVRLDRVNKSVWKEVCYPLKIRLKPPLDTSIRKISCKKELMWLSLLIFQR